jgi:hypothetical protein
MPFVRILGFRGIVLCAFFVLAESSRVYAAPPAPIQVSPSGNDSGDGSVAKPFRTLQRAQVAARQVLAKGEAGVAVELAAGGYRLDKPLTLTNADSGSVYRSRDGIGKAHLVGSAPILGWQVHRDGVWKVGLPEGVVFHTLYENGARGRKARFPNREFLPAFPSARGRYLVTEDGTPKRYNKAGEPAPKGPGWLTYPADDPPPALSGTKTKLLIFTGGKCDWNRSMYKVQSIDPVARKLVFGARGLSFGVGARARFFLEDDMSFLDAPGEFFVDEDTDTLYYKPVGKGHPDQLNITRPVVNRLVEFRGASHTDCVSGIRLEGLVLEETDCLPHQPMWAYSGARDGALIWLTDAAGIAVHNCHLKNSGRHGIMMVGHNTDHLVTGCWIEHMGLNGVSFSNRSRAPDKKSPTEKRCEGNRIHNTHISHVGEIHTYAECVTVFHASHNEVSHCQLDNSVRYAITLRGNTGRQYGPAITNGFPPTKGNHFHHVRVSRCGQDGGDMGALHCANLNNPGGGSVNTFEQITVSDSCAVPSMKDSGADGVFLDWPKMSMDQVFRNVHLIRMQGKQIRTHGPDNGASAQTHNVSWKDGFRTELMEYDSIGLTDAFPQEFGGPGKKPVPPPSPRGLAATAPTYDTVVLNWQQPDRDFLQTPQYTVFRDGEAIALTEGTTFTDVGRPEHTAYRYQVGAQDGDFCHLGTRSSVCTVRTLRDRTPPEVESAWGTWDGKRVRILFSKAMDFRSMSRPEGYAFVPALKVRKVRSVAPECVELAVEGMDLTRQYRVGLAPFKDATSSANLLVGGEDVTVATKGRGAHYPMQLTKDGTLIDCEGGAGDARLCGGAVVMEEAGPFGGPALVLDGKEAYAEASANFSLGDGDFTIMLWMCREGEGHIVLSKGNGFDSPNQWSFGWPGKGTPGSVSFRVVNQFHCTALRSVPHKRWTHVAFVCRAGKGSAYVNGELSGGPYDLSSVGPFANDEPLRIGRRAHEPDPQFFTGKIADIRLLSYALAPAEIQTIAQPRKIRD